MKGRVAQTHVTPVVDESIMQLRTGHDTLSPVVFAAYTVNAFQWGE